MAKLQFNKKFRDKETNKVIQANKPIDMTLTRADEVVKNIKGKHKGYEDFSYERLDVEEKEEAVKEETTGKTTKK